MTSRWRVLLACTLGVLFAIVPFLNLSRMKNYTFNSSVTGIAVGKLLLLDYFVFMPWPITNLMRIAYFQEIHYLGNIYEPDTVPLMILSHSIFFFLGALIAEVLSGAGAPRQGETILQRQGKGILLSRIVSILQANSPPWMLYTFLILVVHLLLMGAATTHYTGPTGSVWVYPSPFFLIPFCSGIGVISRFTQAIYTRLQEEFTFLNFLFALGTYIVLTVLFYCIVYVGGLVKKSPLYVIPIAIWIGVICYGFYLLTKDTQ